MFRAARDGEYGKTRRISHGRGNTYHRIVRRVSRAGAPVRVPTSHVLRKSASLGSRTARGQNEPRRGLLRFLFRLCDCRPLCRLPRACASAEPHKTALRSCGRGNFCFLHLHHAALSRVARPRPRSFSAGACGGADFQRFHSAFRLSPRVHAVRNPYIFNILSGRSSFHTCRMMGANPLRCWIGAFFPSVELVAGRVDRYLPFVLNYA